MEASVNCSVMSAGEIYDLEKENDQAYGGFG